MIKSKIIVVMIAIALVFTMAACVNEKEGNRVTANKPGKNITVIEDANKEAEESGISVEKIERVEKAGIFDWLDEDTTVVSKENASLDKMKLAELSGYYPKSLYLYSLASGEYKLLKEKKEVFMGEATLSPDKKYLLYNEFSLGDPVFYVMNMETSETFGIHGENIGGAISAGWDGKDAVIGAAYSGGAYLVEKTGKITAVDGLENEALYIVEKINNYIFYNTQADANLMRLDINTGDKVDLKLDGVYAVIPSPDRNQLLVLQAKGSKKTMIICNTDGSGKINIAEGVEIGGVSWSPDQRMIAYNLKSDENSTAASSLLVYDIPTGKAAQLAVDMEYQSSCWSPSGKKLACTSWDGGQYNSSIVYLK